MNNASQMMSDAKFYESYSRYDEPKGKYESWDEAVERVMDMHWEQLHMKNVEVTPELIEMMDEVQVAYSKKKILGAQRALQFGGAQLHRNNARMYNCTATYCDRVDFFQESMFLMLSGCGIGFSVQTQHIKKLPDLIKRDNELLLYEIEDSIEGWAQAIGVAIKSFFDVKTAYSGHRVHFDYSLIRPEGAEISGGFKAPGPEPLKLAIEKIEKLLTGYVKDNTRMSPIVAYDLTMFSADAVISGGVRRSASICMFSPNDKEMLNAKTGDWFIKHPHRGRSNNSVVLDRNTTTQEQFAEIMDSVKDFGEPGFVWTDNMEILFNPCVEVGMYGYDENKISGWQSCNLTEINGSKSINREEFLHQCKTASILGTIQASYTNFEFLTESTTKIIEKEALIGVGITGWMNEPELLFDPEIQREGAEMVKKWNKITAEMIGINQAARCTVVKPSGNASVILGCASGIHGEHSKHYIRHVQMNKQGEVAKLIAKTNPKMTEDSVWSMDKDYVFAFPITPSEHSLYKKNLLGTKQLEYVKSAQNNWIEYGTNYDLCVIPEVRHNVSNTITVDDWDEVEKFIFDNRNSLCGVSLLASAGDLSYSQAPFAEVKMEDELIELYGSKVMFCSGLIEAGLQSFNNDLWNATATCLGFGEELGETTSANAMKKEFVRRFDKFSKQFTSKEECSNALKQVYLLHKWFNITNNLHSINWETELVAKEFVDANTLGSQGCSGGSCEVEF